MKKLAIITLALLPLALRAQDTSYNAYNESVYVQGDFRPVIEQSFKLSIAPSIHDTAETMQRAFTYGITPQRITSIFSPARMAFAKINEPPQRLYNNYIRLGMGNYWSPLADLYFHSTRSKTLQYGTRLSHQSSWGTIGHPNDSIPSPDYYGKNHFSNTQLDLFGKYILKEKHQFSADLDYENDYHTLYGFSDSTLFAQTGITRDSFYSTNPALGMTYNLLGLSLGAKSLHTDLNRFGYDANAQIGNLWGSHDMSELRYALNGTVHYGFPMLKDYKGIAYLRLSHQGWHSQMDSTLSANRFILQATPYIDFIFRSLQIHAGATLAFDRFSSDTAIAFVPIPDLVVSTKFMNDALSLNLGATGGIEANDWNAIRLINPYVAPAVEERATRHWDFYGHMRLTFSKKLELNARAQFSFLSDDLNFRTDTALSPLGNLFATDYVSYQRATLGADLTFVNDEMLSATLAGHYYGYLTDTTLLYRPNWDASLRINLNYKDKLRLHLESLLLGQMQASEKETLPMRYGLGLEVEYLHTRALSFFAKVDNILCQRYFYWANYPSQRLQFMLGLTYTVPHK